MMEPNSPPPEHELVEVTHLYHVWGGSSVTSETGKTRPHSPCLALSSLGT